MRSNPMLSEEKFWLVVDEVLALESRTPLESILERFELSKAQFNCFYTFFKDIGVDIKLFDSDEVSYLSVGKNKDIKISMTLGQWLKFQAHFPVIEALKTEPFHEEISHVIGKLEKEHDDCDLFYSINNFENILSSSSRLSLVADTELNFVNDLEESIVQSVSCKVKLEGKSHKILPLRLVTIQDQLHLVYESIDLRSLDVVDVNEVSEFEADGRVCESIYGPKEVDSFIKNIRMLDSHEERLVIKIKEFEHFHKDAKNEFFRNEVMVQNYKGEKIWAASIEPNDNIFEWIFSLGKSIEIISSNLIKKEYLKFCQRKLKKLA